MPAIGTAVERDRTGRVRLLSAYREVTLTVGRPYVGWAAGSPYGTWAAGTPYAEIYAATPALEAVP